MKPGRPGEDGNHDVYNLARFGSADWLSGRCGWYGTLAGSKAAYGGWGSGCLAMDQSHRYRRLLTNAKREGG